MKYSRFGAASRLAGAGMLLALTAPTAFAEIEEIVDQFVAENFEEKKINSCIIFDDHYSSRLDSKLITKMY